MENKSSLEKTLMKAEKAMEATPECKAYEEAWKAKKEACRAVYETKEAYDKACENLYEKGEALGEAEKTMHATPEYKKYDKAHEAYMKTFEHKEYLKERKAK